jgi:hypothetical protein
MRNERTWEGKQNHPEPVASGQIPFTQGKKENKENKAKKELSKGPHGTRDLRILLMENWQQGIKKAADYSKARPDGGVIREAKLWDN